MSLKQNPGSPSWRLDALPELDPDANAPSVHTTTHTHTFPAAERLYKEGRATDQRWHDNNEIAAIVHRRDERTRASKGWLSPKELSKSRFGPYCTRGPTRTFPTHNKTNDPPASHIRSKTNHARGRKNKKQAPSPPRQRKRHRQNVFSAEHSAKPSPRA